MILNALFAHQLYARLMKYDALGFPFFSFFSEVYARLARSSFKAQSWKKNTCELVPYFVARMLGFRGCFVEKLIILEWQLHLWYYCTNQEPNVQALEM